MSILKQKITIKEILNIADQNKIKMFIFDFDYTLIKSFSSTSIGVFNKLINSNYYNKKNILDYITKHFQNKQIYKYIWKLKLKLLSKYNLEFILANISIAKHFIPNDNIIKLIRKIAKKQNYDIVIYSSGLKCVIKKFLMINKLNKYKITLLANDPNNLKKIITPYKTHLSTNQKIICFGDNKKDLYLTKDSINILVKDDELYLL